MSDFTSPIKHYVNIAEPDVSATVNCSARIPQDPNSRWVFKDQSSIVTAEFASMTSKRRSFYRLITRVIVVKSMAGASDTEHQARNYQ
jgi:hypothetical protein